MPAIDVEPVSKTPVVIQPLQTGAPAVIAIQTIPGPPGTPGNAQVYVEDFPVSGTWTVNHNLGRKPAAVSVLTVGGVEVEAQIVHTSVNQLVVTVNPPMAGQVIVS